jgi:hypothetical protein
MSDTTAFLAGCATTGVAVLVLLVARAGFTTADRTPLNAAANLPETAMPVPIPPDPKAAETENVTEELRRELDRQRELTHRLESQLTQQELRAQNLENQLNQQQDETRRVLAQIGDYQRSVDTLSLQNSQLAESRQQSGIQTTLLWIGGGLLLVLVLGGGGLILCLIFLAMQSRRQDRGMTVMYSPMPAPHQPDSYRYYEQEFLPPVRSSRRAAPYQPPHYDYEG